jgi:hypothetical protein
MQCDMRCVFNQMLRHVIQPYQTHKHAIRFVLLLHASPINSRLLVLIAPPVSSLLSSSRLLRRQYAFFGPLFVSIGRLIVAVIYDSTSLLSADRLSLAGAGGSAFGGRRGVLLASGQSSLATAESPLDLLGSRERLVLHFDQSTGSASTALLHRLLVGGNIEADEQDQVAGQDAHSGECSELLAGADAGAREPREVAGGEVGVRGEVDEAEVDNELGDLEDGDVLLPPDADAAGGLEVVPVHDNVDREVKGDDDPGDGGVAEELGVAEEGGGTVVVGVEEGQGLLLEDEEDGVDQFEVLGQVIKL